MKKLLKKEMILTASPLSYLFLLFTVMALIPGYPILVGTFFVCLGIFYTFQFSREHHDILYTALLPVKKNKVVTAKYAFTVGIEAAAFLLSVLFTLLALLFCKNAGPYLHNAMMNANLAYLGYMLILFALFNGVFLRGFFQTAYYVGKPFILYSVVALVAIGAAETLHHIPGLAWLNSQQGAELPRQTVVLLIGAAVYGVVTWLSMRLSEKRFDTIDL